METLEISSSRDMTTDVLLVQVIGSYRYKIDRHQFISAYSSRQHGGATPSALLALTTVDGSHIWMSDKECGEIAAAIRASRPTVTLA